MVQLLKYGFPLAFNRNNILEYDKQNHAWAVNYPKDIQAYLWEEMLYGAILGSFDINPIELAHYSPFMSRYKPGSQNRTVKIDLSWPKGNSINDGMHVWALTSLCPTVDHITDALKNLGKGSHLFKIDISRVFRYIKVDPADYDLLALHWDGKDFIDTCVPFGSRHRTQIFQHLSNAVRYIHRAIKLLIMWMIS